MLVIKRGFPTDFKRRRLANMTCTFQSLEVRRMCYYNRLTCSCVTAVSSKVFEEGLLSDFLCSRLRATQMQVRQCYELEHVASTSCLGDL